jgi:hypothetical protein
VPIPVAARSKAWVCGTHLLGLWSRIPHAAWTSVSCENVCCQLEISATGRSLVQRSPIKCGVSECDFEISTWRTPRPTTVVKP